MGLLEILIVVLLILWIAGMWSGVTAGGLIHVLLVILVIVIVVRLLQGRRPLG